MEGIEIVAKLMEALGRDRPQEQGDELCADPGADGGSPAKAGG